MIFNFLVDAVFNLFSFAINKFPDGNPAIASLIINVIYQTKEFIAPFNWIFPATDFFLVINLVILLLIASLVFSTVRWVLSIVTLNLIH